MDLTTDQISCIIKKNDQNDFVDVCTTEYNYENKENTALCEEKCQNELNKSPTKKNSLIATFKRMSPFKLRQSNNQSSCQTSLSSSSTISSRKLFGLSSTTKASLMQKFANFTSLDVLTPTTSEAFDTQKNESNKQSKTKIDNEEEKDDCSSFLYEPKSFDLIQNLKKQTDGSSSVLYPSTSFPYKDELNLNTISKSKINESNFIINDDAESEIDESNNSSDNVAIKTSRKEKSLGKLCRRFLLTMGEEAKNSTNDIHLESVARKMNVEKRRIYDIVNVMEALEAMSKTNKSFYRWHGLSALPQLMDTLQKEAIKEKIPERIKEVEKAMCNFIDLKSVKILQPSKKSSYIVGSFIDNCAIKKCHSSSSIKNASSLSKSFNDSDKNWTDNLSNNLNISTKSNDSVILKNFDNDRGIGNCASGKNSLAQLCRRFLMVLLSNPSCNRRVSLDVASTILIKNTESEGFEPPSRGRCRRLYDIANVLVAMELIKKVHYLFGTKKIPLFIYCGPEPDASLITAKSSMQDFLKRIGLSGIDIALNNDNENNDNINQKAKTLFNYSSQQKNRKIRIPRVHSQKTFENKIFPASSTLSLDENFMPPLIPNKFNHLKNDEQHQSLKKMSFLEFSNASKSLSSSASSLSSTLSQSSSPSSSKHHLAEMAEMMRKRIHTTATSLSMPFLEKKNNLINLKNKENKTKAFEFKRQKISSIINENINAQKTIGTINDINHLVELPNPQPISPLTSLNFLQSHQQQKIHQNNSMNTAATISGLFKKVISPQMDTNTSTITSSVELSNNFDTKNILSFAPFTNDSSFSYFMMHPALTSTSLNISPSNILEQQQVGNKPKVAHSVSAILGNSQSDNIQKNNQLNMFLTLSPKAFKPINKNK